MDPLLSMCQCLNALKGWKGGSIHPLAFKWDEKFHALRRFFEIVPAIASCHFEWCFGGGGERQFGYDFPCGDWSEALLVCGGVSATSKRLLLVISFVHGREPGSSHSNCCRTKSPWWRQSSSTVYTRYWLVALKLIGGCTPHRDQKKTDKTKRITTITTTDIYSMNRWYLVNATLMVAKKIRRQSNNI